MHGGAVGPDVFEQVAGLVVGVTVVAAIGTDVVDDVLGIVAEEPLGAFVRMDDAVGVPEPIVVMPCFLPVGISDVGEADVRVPLQPHLEAAVVGPLVHGTSVGAFALPFQIHPAAGTVGVAGDQVVLVLIGPDLGVFILGQREVARLVVAVQAQASQGLVLAHQPQADDASMGVHVGAQVGVRLARVVLIGDQVRQHDALVHAVVVTQQQARAAAQLDLHEQEALAVALVGFAALVAAAQDELVVACAHEEEVFDAILMELPDLG